MTLQTKNISRGIWQELRAGTPFAEPLPDTGPFTNNFYGLKPEEGIDYQKLVNFIVECTRDDKVLNYQNFAKPATYQYYTVHEMGGGQGNRMKMINNNVPFSYTNEKKVTIQTAFAGKINKRKDHLEDDWGYIIEINPSDKKISATLNFYYEETKDFRQDAKDTIDANDYRIEEKYVAISLTSANLTDYCYLIKEIQGNTHFEFMKIKISERYARKIKAAVDSETLNFLYKNAPAFVLNNLSEYVAHELLVDHLKTLTALDDTGWFSGYRDSSSAVINVMKAIKQHNRLFDLFDKDQNLVKRVFDNLDGTSTIDGILLSNKMIFASILSNLCALNRDRLSNTGDVFKINGGFVINSNAVSDDPEETFGCKIFLKQEQKAIFPLFVANTVVPVKYDKDINEGEHYLPLDMVVLIDKGQEKEVPFLVPAIYVKALSHEAEMVSIQKNLRIGLDIVAVIIGLATLGSGTPLALSLLDIGLAAGDASIQTFSDEIKAMEGGEAFLNTWEHIYLVGGIATAGPVLVETLFVKGAKLIATAKNINVANFIRSSLLKVVLEIEIANFTKNTVRFITKDTEIVLATSGVLNKYHLDKLLEQSVFLVSGEIKVANKTTNGYALLYKGEAIAVGEKIDFYNQIKSISKDLYNPKKLIETLEDLWKNKSYKLIEILDNTKKPIGEFDEIFHNKKLFVEDKSAAGLLTNINPKTGKPWQTFEQWAQKQIYEKTANRIEALKTANSTRARLADGLSPEITNIRDIRNLEFQIIENNIDLQNAVSKEIMKLKGEFPDWEFTAKYGK